MSTENLISAVINNDINEVSRLIKAGADINVHNEDGYSVLMLPACFGHEGIVDKLIQIGVDVHDKNKENATAYDLACYNNHIDIANNLDNQMKKIKLN